MKKLILTLIGASLTATEFQPTPPIPKMELTMPKNSFNYMNIGVNGFVPHWIGPDIAFGWRRLNSHHVFDMNLGYASSLTFGGGLQVSYLYYPKMNQGIYFGAGVTAGVGLVFIYKNINSIPFPYANIPVTVGYQFKKEKEKVQFLQLQVTSTRSTTVSYGFGF